nr:uncharacterized protein LOC105325740 isoform X2 [Crassostrea gigas]
MLKFYIRSGLDKDGFQVKYISDFEDSDSDPFDSNESSLVEESYSDSLSSVDEILESKEKKNPRTVKWSKEDAADLKSHFRKYIFTQKDNNTGNLPCKKEIEDFLKTNNISSLDGLHMKTTISKARTKIFNERKTARLRTSKKLEELELVAI